MTILSSLLFKRKIREFSLQLYITKNPTSFSEVFVDLVDGVTQL